MRRLLIGPALLGATYAGGAVYGADTRQVVHKAPDAVYSAIQQAISGARQSGTMKLEGGQPVPYELRLDQSSGERLIVSLMLNGQQGAEANFGFAPENGGKDTLVTLKIHTDHNVLRQTLAGTDKAKLAYAPDWLLNITARPVLRQLAQQIEKGGAVSDPTQSFVSPADWESNLPPEQREAVQEWREYDASRPMVDPNADAERYLNKSQ